MERPDDLLAGLKCAEEAAFRQVIEGELDGLHALVLGLLDREADADDACQEALLKLLRFAPRLSTNTSLRAGCAGCGVRHRVTPRRGKGTEFAPGGDEANEIVGIGHQPLRCSEDGQGKEAETGDAIESAALAEFEREAALGVFE